MRADAILTAEVDCSILGCNANRFEWSESCFDEELDFALISKTGKDSPVARRIGTSEMIAAGLGKRQFEVHFLAQESSDGRISANAGTLEQIALRGLTGHCLNDSRLEIRSQRS